MIRSIVMLGLIAVFATPAFACGPTGGGKKKQQQAQQGTTTTTVTSGGGGQRTPREKWVRHRMGDLKETNSEYKKSQNIANLGDLALGTNTYQSSAAYRQHLVNRFEFLALKREKGRATQGDVAEMNLILRTLGMRH